MRKVTIAAALIASGLTATPAAPSTLHLNWNDCSAGASASALETFLCADDTSSFRLIGSVVMDGVTSPITGMEAYVDFLPTGTVPIPDWWQLQTGGCRDGSLLVTPLPPAPTSCANFWP